MYLEVSALLSIMRRAAIFIMPVHCLDKVSVNAYGIQGVMSQSASGVPLLFLVYYLLFVSVPLTYCSVVMRLYHSMKKAMLSNGPVLPDAVT